MPSEKDLVVPPRSIWDPPNLRSRRSTTTSPASSSSRDKKVVRRTDLETTEGDDSEWDVTAMKIQIYDSFRLARIILGNPIKTQRLTSHLILHAICKVAEMKLLISKLQNEMMNTNEQYFASTIHDDNKMAVTGDDTRRPPTSITKEEEQQRQQLSPLSPDDQSTPARSKELQYQHDTAKKVLQYEVDASTSGSKQQQASGFQVRRSRLVVFTNPLKIIHRQPI